MLSLGLLVKPASGACNMRCDYCFYRDEAQNRLRPSYGYMTEETLVNMLRRTLPHAERSFSLAFQGGEPTLCGLSFFETVIAHVERLNRNRVPVQYSIQTNGYSLDESWAEFFHEHRFLVGLSIDGIQPTHDAYRHTVDGADSYTTVVRAAELLDRFQVEYNILTVVHAKTAPHIREIYEDYRSRGWDFLQFIACLNPLEEPCLTERPDYALMPQMYGCFLIELFDLWYDDLKHGRRVFIRQFDNYLGMMMGYVPESCEQSGVCGLQYVTEADGSVFPCDFYALDEYLLGNWNTDRLEAIDRRRAEIRFRERSTVRPETCKDCKWFPLCRGGCYRNRMESGAGPSSLCEGYKMFFEARASEFTSAGRLYTL